MKTALALIDIIARLRRGQVLTAWIVAANYGVSVRTAQRWLSTLYREGYAFPGEQRSIDREVAWRAWKA